MERLKSGYGTLIVCITDLYCLLDLVGYKLGLKHCRPTFFEISFFVQHLLPIFGHGMVSCKNPTPNSPLGRELPPRGGGVSQGDGTHEGPKGQIEGAAVSQFLHLVSVTTYLQSTCTKAATSTFRPEKGPKDRRGSIQRGGRNNSLYLSLSFSLSLSLSLSLSFSLSLSLTLSHSLFLSLSLMY